MKLIMSEQEYREAIDKAREEGREAGYTEATDGWNDVIVFCRDCEYREERDCPVHTVLKVTDVDYCSMAKRREQTDE